MLVLKNLGMTKSVWEKFCKTLVSKGYERGVDIPDKLTWEVVSRGPYKYKPYEISKELYDEISTASSGKKKKIDPTMIEQSTSIEDDEVYSSFKPKNVNGGVCVLGENENDIFDIEKVVVRNKGDYDYENENTPGRLANKDVYNLSLDHTSEIKEILKDENSTNLNFVWNQAFEDVAGSLNILNVLNKIREKYIEKRGKNLKFDEVNKIDHLIDSFKNFKL